MPCLGCGDNCGRATIDQPSTPVFVCGGTIEVSGGGGEVQLVTPAYSHVMFPFGADTSPAPFTYTVPANTREMTFFNITRSDFVISHNLGTTIVPVSGVATIAEPSSLDISQAVFSGDLTITAIGLVGPLIDGNSPRILINFKAWA